MDSRSKSHQLYSLSRIDFEAPNYVGHEGTLHVRPGGNIPLVTWPNGRWCHAANTFIRERFELGLSRRNRGGTLAVLAAHITHLIRFCFARNLDLRDLTDGQFSAFVAELYRCDRANEARLRDANTVIAIARSCLALLDSVGRNRGQPDFVSSTGQIRAEKRTHVVQTGGTQSSAKRVNYWHHPALPNADPKKRRLPIATGNIEAIRAAVGKISTSSHQRQRRHTILRLLETTGARRGEIAGITVASVESAFRMERPMLRVPTLKKRRNRDADRLIPLSLHDVGFIRQYAEVHRKSVVRRKRAGKPDHGILLVSEVDGEPLTPGTITQEIRLLRIAAGIEERACPHMFRHRFLTKLFVALIEHHEIENPDAFRRMLIDGEQLKRKVVEWTDQASLQSLDIYINLAFDEVGNYKRIYDMASVNLALDSFSGTIAAELDCVRDGEEPSLILGRLDGHLERLKVDLARAKAAIN